MSSSSSSSSMSLTKDTDPIVSQVPQETKGLDETMEEPNMVHLVSKQGNKFSIDLKYAMASNLVKQALDADKVSKDVDCPQVTTEILGEVVKYLNHHKGVEMTLIERPLRSKVMKDVLKDTWDAEFIDRIGEDRQTLYDLVLAANYMDIKPLLDLGCGKVASLIKGQPLEKIKGILSVEQKKEEQGAGGEKKDSK